jgi:hypothetical protein
MGTLGRVQCIHCRWSIGTVGTLPQCNVALIASRTVLRLISSPPPSIICPPSSVWVFILVVTESYGRVPLLPVRTHYRSLHCHATSFFIITISTPAFSTGLNQPNIHFLSYNGSTATPIELHHQSLKHGRRTTNRYLKGRHVNRG